MEELLQAISTVGFPIAICTYIIVKLERIVDENTRATRENNTLIRELKILVEKMNGGKK